jgi:hypothetical protein
LIYSLPLTARTLECQSGATGVINAWCNSMIVMEIIFRQITRQMLLLAMLVDALGAPFEDTKISLNRIHVGFTGLNN